MWRREGPTSACVLGLTMPARMWSLTSDQRKTSVLSLMLYARITSYTCPSCRPLQQELHSNSSEGSTKGSCSMCSCPKSLVGPYHCSSPCRLEVKGPRELAFFKGKAVGPVYPGFCYESEAGAHAAPIAFPALATCQQWQQPRYKLPEVVERVCSAHALAFKLSLHHWRSRVPACQQLSGCYAPLLRPHVC